jgi:hypothetical protein
MRKTKNPCSILAGKREERDHLGKTEVGKRTIIEWILKE